MSFYFSRWFWFNYMETSYRDCWQWLPCIVLNRQYVYRERFVLQKSCRCFSFIKYHTTKPFSRESLFMGQRDFMRIITKKGTASLARVKLLLAELFAVVLLFVMLLIVEAVLSVVLKLFSVVPLVTTFEGRLPTRVFFVKFPDKPLLTRIFKFWSHSIECLLDRATKVKQMNAKLPLNNLLSLGKCRLRPGIGARNFIMWLKGFDF